MKENYTTKKQMLVQSMNILPSYSIHTSMIKKM